VPSDPGRILILSARVGAGHVQAARAIEEGLAARGLLDRTDHLDVMSIVPSWFRRLYAGGYAFLASRAPHVYGRLFHLTDASTAPWPNAAERCRIRFESNRIQPLRDRILRNPPAWIIHTHFLAPPVIGRWIAGAALPTKQAVVVTDYYPHRVWLADDVTHYFVGAERTREQLIRRGIAADTIHVTGLPILARHRRNIDVDRVYRDFNWLRDRPAILLITGSDFVVGPIETILRRLLSHFPDVTIQLLTGHNQALERRIRARFASAANLRVLGFTERINELLAAATIVISKTGGIITAECLAHGAPMVALFPLPGQERLNAQMLVENDAGALVEQAADLLPAVRRLLADPAKTQRFRTNACKLARPDAADQIVDMLIHSMY